MGERIEADVDRARAKPAFAIAEVELPQALEGFLKAHLLDLGPRGEKAAPPFAQRQRVAVAEIVRREQAKPMRLRGLRACRSSSAESRRER